MGKRFTVSRLYNLRSRRGIPRFDPASRPDEAELFTVEKAAEILDVAPSTVHRWINDGFIAAEQLTPGAPWRIRMTDKLRARFVEEALRAS